MGLFDFLNKVSGQDKMLKMQAKNDIRIITETSRILATTKDPDVFYSRLDLMEKTLNDLCQLEQRIKITDVSPTQMRQSFYDHKEEMRAEFHSRRNPKDARITKYYKDMDQIEMMWSVLQNMKAFHGSEADSLENKCLESIDDFTYMSKINSKKGIANPKSAPCFIRLAMLYEKQERYEEAIQICASAIRSGAYDDHSKGKMYGRLARMIKKAGVDVSPDIMMLTDSNTQ